MKWLIAFLIFSLLVLFHEFGHFLAARLNGVEVEEFSLGFGPRLFSARKGGTRYSIKLLLFGGSCRMKDMMIFDENDDGSLREPEEGSFLAAPVGRRAAIIFAGPLFNFILAFICAVIVISVVGYDPAEVLYVAEGSPADEAGLESGDLITSFMGSHTDIGRDVDNWFMFNDLKEDTEITMTVRRDGNTHKLSFAPYVMVRYMLGLTYNLEDGTARINEVSANSPLEEAGVEAGDLIVGIGAAEITTSKSLNEYFNANPLTGDPVTMTFMRDGKSYERVITPVRREQMNLGFSYNLARVNTSAPGVIKYSLIELRYWIATTIHSVASLFTGRFSVNDLSGPVGVVDIVGTTYEETKSEGPLMTWMNMLNLIILLSANLGVMNLLPIPALDGGRLVFLLYEAVRGKPVDRNVEAGLQTVAAVLLMILMVYVMYHDVSRFGMLP